MQKDFLNLDLVHPHLFRLLKKTQIEEDMVVKSKWGLVIDLIHIKIKKLSRFFYVVLLLLKLSAPITYKLLKIDKK